MNIIAEEKQQQIMAMTRAGLSIRMIAARIGVNKGTVNRYTKQAPPGLCPCGLVLGHRVICSWRIAIMPGRQEFLLATRPIRETTLARWARRAQKIEDRIKEFRAAPGAVRLNMRALRRVHGTQRTSERHKSIVEVNRFVAKAFGDDDRADKIIAVLPEQESYWPSLQKAIARLPTALKIFAQFIIADNEIIDAARTAGISETQIPMALAELRVALGPALGR